MSSAYPHIERHFQDSAALLMQCQTVLAEPTAAAGQVLLSALMNDGKLLLCGNGTAAALADSLCTHLVLHLEQERMELAALSLCNNHAILKKIEKNIHAEQLFAKQIQALGKQHDVLLVISALGDEANLCAAVTAAHERDMTVIAITGGVGGNLAACLHERDVLLNIPHTRPLRIWEAQSVLIHALCDHLDHLLLGGDA